MPTILSNGEDSRAVTLRHSILAQMERSPAHALYALERAAQGVDWMTPTPAMRFGTLGHSILLGTKLPAVFDGDRRAGKAWEAFVDAHPGEEIVKRSEFEKGAAMALALARDPKAVELLTMGVQEETLLETLEGREVRATPDVRLDAVRSALRSPGRLVELKTTADASLRRFPWIAAGKFYASQMAMQKDVAIRGGLVTEDAELWIVAIETSAPFVVGLYRLTEDAEASGRRTYQRWLADFQACEASDTWLGYGENDLDAPDSDAALIFAEESEEVEA